MHIGYLGAGFMASPMIANLLDDGHSVSVWNRTSAKAQALGALGAQVVPSPEQVCEAGGVIVSCLSDDHALDTLFEDGDILRTLGAGGVHVSMSTISPTCAKRLSKNHNVQNVAYLAVPICGRPEAVEARAQSFLFAGDSAAKERVKGVLAALGRKLFDFGEDPSAANIAKINFNFLIASATEAMAEAFSIAEKSGLDPKDFYEMVIGTAFGCPLYENYGRIIHQKGWDKVGFRLTNGLKDIRLAAETAADCGGRMRLGELLEKRFEEAVENGLGEKDWTAIAAQVREEAGL